MRPLLLSLSLLAGACATASPGVSPGTSPMATVAAPAPDPGVAPTAALTLVGYPGGGAQMSVSFDAEVPISPTKPALVIAGGEQHSATLESAPSVARAGGTVASSAVYRLDRDGRAAAEAAGTSARLMLHDGTAYRTYPVSRPDLLN